MARRSTPSRIPDDAGYNLYLRRISRHRCLTPEEEAGLARRIRAGDETALADLVKANLRFVVSVSRNYLNQGLSLQDLINEGNLGLIRAAHRFDERKNFKFISYAVWWVRQAVLQALAEQSRIVKLPLNRVGTIHRVGKAHSRLEQRLHRQPNPEEIARELSIRPIDVRETLCIGNSHVSLDAPLNGDDLRLMDTLRAGDQDGELGEVSLREEIGKVLGTLTEREQAVISLYFGLTTDTPLTLEEIGERLGLTRERVRQIKERAIKRLKHGSRSSRLQPYRSAPDDSSTT